jgi:hypothetical protein
MGVHRDLQVENHRPQIELRVLDALVLGDDHADVVPQALQGFGQRAGDVRQPAYLGERHRLGGGDQDAHSA